MSESILTKSQKLNKSYIGQKFNYWTVIDFIGIRGKHAYSLCRCKCSKEKIVRFDGVKSGGSKSCGCLKKEKLLKRVTKHGEHKSSLYRMHNAMKQRCGNPQDKAYKWYGKRGIKVCDRWLEDMPQGYLNYTKDIESLGPKPEGRYSIDRINNDGNYELSNIKWSTQKEQCLNQRKPVPTLVNCGNCNSLIKTYPSKIKRVKSGNKFCSIKCRWEHHLKISQADPN